MPAYDSASLDLWKPRVYILRYPRVFMHRVNVYRVKAPVRYGLGYFYTVPDNRLDIQIPSMARIEVGASSLSVPLALPRVNAFYL